MRVRMSLREQAAFKSFAEQASAYFEFGIGGSTYLASELVKGRVVAVDSSKEWVDKAMEAVKPSDFERRLIAIDIGATRGWGYPKNVEGIDKYRPYFNAIAEHKPAEFDLCLVDGRFRVACFLTALKHMRADAVVAIHDYRIRDHYHFVEKYARKLVEDEDIAFFVRKHGVDFKEIDAAIETYGVDAR